MKIKWFGTATLAMEYGKNKILFDPFFPMNEELPSPERDILAKSGDIFITHGHFDHLIDVPKVLDAGRSKVYCSKETAEVLISNGVDRDNIFAIAPGEIIKKGPLEIEVFQGAHIRFDLPLIMKTLFSRRTLTRFQDLKKMSKLARLYPEGRVLIYKVSAGGKSIIHLGSLNFDPSETYPEDCDLLTLPFQGRSDLPGYTLQFIERLRPGSIYLHHFDDSFPPVSSRVDVAPFIKTMNTKYPEIKVIVPTFGETVEI